MPPPDVSFTARSNASSSSAQLPYLIGKMGESRYDFDENSSS
jgi:hypothetical protein